MADDERIVAYVQVRRGDQSYWDTYDAEGKRLLLAEPGLLVQDGPDVLKFGDGVSKFANLPVHGGDGNLLTYDASTKSYIVRGSGQNVPTVGNPGNIDSTVSGYFQGQSATRDAADGRYLQAAAVTAKIVADRIATVARSALAAGSRLKAQLTGNLGEPASGVTLEAITALAATSSLSIGTASFATSGNLITTSVAHGLVVGNAVSFGTMSNAVGVDPGPSVYYVISTPSTTTLTVSGTPGGSARTITAAGTSVAVYRREPGYSKPLASANTVFRIAETRGAQANINFPRDTYLAPDPTIITTGTGTATYTNMRVEAEFTGDRVGVLLRNTGSLLCTVLVDGRVVGTYRASDLNGAGINSGDLGRVTFAFTSRRRRTVTLLFDSLSEFGGVDFQPTFDPIFPTSTYKGARVLVVGDSFTEGTGAGTGWSYVRWLSFLMGWNDVWKAGSGGTGYVKALDTGRPALISRYQNDIIAQNPQVVVIAMGLNDQTSYEADPTTFLNAATTIWDAVLATSSIRELIIIGPWPNGGGSGVVASLIDMDAKLYALAATRHVRYISPISEGWTFTRSDATHPDAAGHESIATRVAGHLAVPYAP